MREAVLRSSQIPMKTLRTIAVGIMCGLLTLGAAPKEPRVSRGELPTLPNSSLLVGLSPSLLVVTNPREDVRLQPEYEQPDTQDSSSLFPSITRDGKTIAYARLKSAQPARILEISTYSITTGRHREYATGEYSGSTAISPDGSRLAYPGERPLGEVAAKAGDNHLHIVDLKTGDQVIGPQITSSPWPVFASWSPDSRELAFAVSGEIRVWDSGTNKVRKVADGDLPVWSPSGEWIAYLPSEQDVVSGKIVFAPGRWGPKCMVVHPDGTGQRTLIDWIRAKDYRTFVEPPVWSPDSKMLLLNELDDGDKGTVTVYALDTTTLNVKTLFRKSIQVLGWARAN